MNAQKNVVMFVVVALVTGTTALVYAQNEAPKSGQKNAAPATSPNAASSQTPQVSYEFNALPEPVKQMLQQVAAAAESGEIENMRPVLESNELKPMVTTAYVEDPIGYWKKQSADGSGRDILATMLNVLSSGFVKIGQGQDEMYVWPYFAEIDLAKLTPAQEVELYRIVPPALALPMKQAGKYGYYRFGISPSGVWHYFIQ